MAKRVKRSDRRAWKGRRIQPFDVIVVKRKPGMKDDEAQQLVRDLVGPGAIRSSTTALFVDKLSDVKFLDQEAMYELGWVRHQKQERRESILLNSAVNSIRRFLNLSNEKDKCPYCHVGVDDKHRQNCEMRGLLKLFARLSEREPVEVG